MANQVGSYCKTVRDLSRDELIELKQHMLCENEQSPSYGELADADLLISDEALFERFDGTEFSKDDFFCNQED